jgi:phosphatidylglycerophosphate synthase
VPELGYLATIGAMLTAYVRALGMSAGGPPVFVGPMGKPQRMAVVTACAVACAVLPNELGEAIRLAAIAAGVCFAGALVTAGRGLAATATYLRGLPP